MENQPKILWGLGSWTAARWREYGFRLVLELVVVFMGVYLASAFASYQRNQENDARRHQIRQALMREIEGITSNTRNASVQVRAALRSYEDAAQRKEFLAPQPMIEPVRFQTHMWEATLQSDALDLFDVATVYQLSEFYNQLSEGFEQLAQLRELSERFLLPAAGSPPSEFYSLETGRPKAAYTWYFDGMQRLARLAEDITSQGERLVAHMQREDGYDDSRNVEVGGVRAEITLRHLVPPALFVKRLPAGTRALTLRDQDLDSAALRVTQANPSLLDHGVAVLSIVQADSFAVGDRTAAGAYALWWLYAVEIADASRRVLVPLAEWHVKELADGPMRAARRPTTTASINLEPAAAGSWTVQLNAADVQIQASCAPGQFTPMLSTDVRLHSTTQRYAQRGGERARCAAKWNVTGAHPVAEAVRAAVSGPAAPFQSTAFGRGWRARVTGDPDR
jgi:hypothetical protein